MSFLTRHNSVTVHTHLTQEGKKRLADGDLRIERIAFSDAEVNYRISHGSGDTYTSYSSNTFSPSINTITSSPYRRSGVISTNYDGTAPFRINAQDIYSITETIVEPVASIGFYSSVTASAITLADYRINTSLAIGTGYTGWVYNTPSSTNPFGKGPNFNYFNLSGVTAEPPADGLVFIQFIIPSGPDVTAHNEKNIGRYANFFRYSYSAGTYILYVDRALPRYDVASVQKEQPMWFYPLSGYSNWYGSGTTTVCPIWNMNILHRTPQIGHERKTAFEPRINATYVDVDIPVDIPRKSYGSKNISGLVKSFGLDHLPKCGVLHYTNSFSGSVYGDYLMPRETIVDIPHILWHRSGVGGFTGPGLSDRGGLRLVDSGSDIFYDNTGKASYTLLKDGSGPLAQTVGRVYFEAKLIVLTDQELLTALEPKSNRNWTCPAFNIDLVSQTDNETISTSGFTGIAQPGKRYYITYHMVSYPGQGPRQSVPCAQIQTIDGRLGDDGQPMYIRASFPPNSFPFVRPNPVNVSGTGYNCQWVNGLIQEFDIEDDPGLLNLDPFKWRIATQYGVSRLDGGSTTYLSSTFVNSMVFYFTREEYDTYYKYFQMGVDAGSTGIGQGLGLDKALWPGDLDFFYGNVTAKAVRKNYIRNVHFFLDKSDLNTTTNSTYNSGSTYITEIMLLGPDNKIVGVGKPDRPLEKNDATLIDITMRSYY